MNLQYLLSIKRILLNQSPSFFFALSYLIGIFVGGILLKMPWATTSGDILWVDALYTATSALCVTGLSVVDTGSYFTFWGQLVILALIQIGGLGIMTFAVLAFLSVRLRVSLKQRSFIMETYSPEYQKDIKRIIKFIFTFTFTTEFIGAFLLSASWKGQLSFFENIFYSVFHSVAAFCNAGFSLFPDNLIGYHNNIILNLTITSLIILGGIGFPVMQELWTFMKNRTRTRLSLHTKLVISMTLVLIVFGTFIIWAIERHNLLATMSIKDQFLVSYFQSVTSRTAGFNTIRIDLLNNATLMFIIILMFIGASPGSCGGGIKTSSVAALFVVIWSRITGKETYNIFKASLPRETVSRVITVFIVSTIFVIVILTLLLITQRGGLPNVQSRGLFLEYLFETVSAFGTVGLSMGTSTKINSLGKVFIIIAMFVGRIGILSLVYLTINRKSSAQYQYAEENILIG